jgi:acyl carrier protein
MEGWPAEYESILRDHLPGLEPAEPIVEELNLADCGLDSIGMVSLLIALEDGLDMRVPDELLGTGTFATAGTLWEVVRQARADLAAN